MGGNEAGVHAGQVSLHDISIIESVDSTCNNIVRIETETDQSSWGGSGYIRRGKITMRGTLTL